MRTCGIRLTLSYVSGFVAGVLRPGMLVIFCLCLHNVMKPCVISLVSAKKMDKKNKKDKVILRCIPFSDWSGRMSSVSDLKSGSSLSL